MRILKDRESVKQLVQNQRFNELAELMLRKRSKMRYLLRLLYSGDDLTKWRAVEGVGEVVCKMAEVDLEGARIIIRSLLWSINDESGGIGWGAPECIGEIVYRRPELFGEYASIIISYADEEMLRPGVMWAAGKIALASVDLVHKYIPQLVAFLDDPNPLVRGYAVLLMINVGSRVDMSRYCLLLEDNNTIPVYENNNLSYISIAGLASRLTETKRP